MKGLDVFYVFYFSEKMRLNSRFVRIRQPPREFAPPQVDSKLVSETIYEKINLTRVIRILYNICMAVIKPFNRTSLELKQDRLRQRICLFRF